MEQVAAADKLHGKEEPLCGLKCCKESGDEARLAAKSKNISFQQACLCSVLLQDVLLVHNLDCAHFPCALPLGKNNLQGNISL